MMSPVTTHVLDTAKGCPAAGIEVILERQLAKNEWEQLATGVTNGDGRITDLITAEQFSKGIYRIGFDTGSYLQGEGFFPYAQIIFQIDDETSHYHVPLLLSPYGYSTYRGS